MRDARDDERGLIDTYLVGFSELLASVGLPRRVGRRLTTWPAHAIDVDIAEVFAQTPGPGAGNRMSAA